MFRGLRFQESRAGLRGLEGFSIYRVSCKGFRLFGFVQVQGVPSGFLAIVKRNA